MTTQRGDGLYDIQVPREPGNSIFWQKIALFQLIYSIAGLVLGLATVIGGIVLFLNGIAGSTSWTAKIVGAESNISDAAPGTVLFVVGLFLVFVTRFKVRIKDSPLGDTTANHGVSGVRIDYVPETQPHEAIVQPSKPNLEVEETSKYLRSLKIIVATAIAEAQENSWSSFRDYNNVDGLLRLRNYFGRYFLKLLPIVSAIDGKSVFEASKQLNDLFVKTALNHILDAWYASYIIKDFITTINSIMESKGAGIWRVHFVKEHLEKTWSDIDADNGEYTSSRVYELKRILNTRVENA